MLERVTGKGGGRRVSLNPLEAHEEGRAWR